MWRRVMERAAAWARSKTPREEQRIRDVARLSVALHYRKMLVDEAGRSGVPIDIGNDQFKHMHNGIAASLENVDLFSSGQSNDSAIAALVTEQILGLFDSAVFGQDDKMAAPFSLRSGPSTLAHADAGQGVFVNGYVPPGTVVALYPGIVYAPAHWNKLPNYPQIDKDNSYLITRYDDFLIDAKDYRHNVDALQSRQAALRDEDDHQSVFHLGGVRDLAKIPANPFALGHLINHPDKDAAPNVLKLAYDFPADFPVKFHNSVPNKYISSPPLLSGGHLDILMRTIVFITTDHIHNSEIFLNYRYNPLAPNLPEWYMHHNREEADRLWSKS